MGRRRAARVRRCVCKTADGFWRRRSLFVHGPTCALGGHHGPGHAERCAVLAYAAGRHRQDQPEDAGDCGAYDPRIRHGITEKINVGLRPWSLPAAAVAEGFRSSDTILLALWKPSPLKGWATGS